jgi:hypothetical protein
MTVARELSEQGVALVEQLRNVRAEITALKDREMLLKADIIATLDGADLGCFDGTDLVRVETSWRTTFNIRKFRADPMYGHLASVFSKETPVVSVKLP